MCGRLAVYNPKTKGSLELLGHTIPPNYNAAPSEQLPMMGLLHNVQWMSCNPILSGFGRSIESHSGDYGSIFSFKRHQSGATNRRYDIMQQTHDRSPVILGAKQDRLTWVSKPYDFSAYLLTVYDAPLAKYPVSRAMNNARNKSTECIAVLKT